MFNIMDECGMSIIKYLLFVFNVLFSFSGIALMVVGGCVLHDVDRFRAFLEISFLAPPIVFIVIGTIVFIISFMGCCGAIKESPCKLTCFAGLLFVIFFCEIAVGILASANKDTFINEMRKSMKASKDNYDPTVSQDRKLWDEIQASLECCGVDGPDDWVMGGSWPASCCKGYDPKAHKDNLCSSKEFLHETGCFEKLKKILIEESHIVLGVGIGLAFLQITGITLACMLASELRNLKKADRD